MSEIKCPVQGCNKTYKSKGAWYKKHLAEKHPGYQENSLQNTVILGSQNYNPNPSQS